MKIIESLREILQNELPGFEAHLKLSPGERVEGLIERNWPKNAKLSAVTFLLFLEKGKLKTLLMKRVEYDGVHSGQISLPGGQKDNEDKTFQDTAIREFFEETGVQLKKENFLGELTDLYIPPSNFLVQPFIAFLPSLPKLTPEKAEVQELHTIALEDLFNPENFVEEEIIIKQRDNKTFTIKAPCYKIKELCIWGATAMMISELESVFTENHLSL